MCTLFTLHIHTYIIIVVYIFNANDSTGDHAPAQRPGGAQQPLQLRLSGRRGRPRVVHAPAAAAALQGGRRRRALRQPSRDPLPHGHGGGGAPPRGAGAVGAAAAGAAEQRLEPRQRGRSLPARQSRWGPAAAARRRAAPAATLVSRPVRCQGEPLV